MVDVPVVVDLPSDGELAVVGPVPELVNTTPTKGAAFNENDGEFGVPSSLLLVLVLVLAAASDVVLVTWPAEYRVFVIVMVGEPFVP